MSQRTFIGRCLAICLPLLAAACGQTMSAPAPSAAVVLALRSPDFPALRVGSFVLGPGIPAGLDKSVTSRSVVLGSPSDGSLAKYLGAVLETNLKAAGKLDSQSPLVMNAFLLKSELATGMGTGDGTLGAQFTLTKSNVPIFEKTLEAKSEWESSFIGAIAIPAAINGYTALYGKLIDQLVADPELKAAVKK